MATLAGKFDLPAVPLSITWHENSAHLVVGAVDGSVYCYSISGNQTVLSLDYSRCISDINDDSVRVLTVPPYAYGNGSVLIAGLNSGNVVAFTVSQSEITILWSKKLIEKSVSALSCFDIIRSNTDPISLPRLALAVGDESGGLSFFTLSDPSLPPSAWTKFLECGDYVSSILPIQALPLPAQGGSSLGVSTTPIVTSLVVGSGDGHIYVYDFGTEVVQTDISPGAGGDIIGLAPLGGDQSKVAAVILPSTIQVWDAYSRDWQDPVDGLSLENEVLASVIPLSGRECLISCDNGSLWTLSLSPTTIKPLYRPDDESYGSDHLALAADSYELAVGMAESGLDVYLFGSSMISSISIWNMKSALGGKTAAQPGSARAPDTENSTNIVRKSPKSGKKHNGRSSLTETRRTSFFQGM